MGNCCRVQTTASVTRHVQLRRCARSDVKTDVVLGSSKLHYPAELSRSGRVLGDEDIVTAYGVLVRTLQHNVELGIINYLYENSPMLDCRRYIQ